MSICARVNRYNSPQWPYPFGGFSVHHQNNITDSEILTPQSPFFFSRQGFATIVGSSGARNVELTPAHIASAASGVEQYQLELVKQWNFPVLHEENDLVSVE